MHLTFACCNSSRGVIGTSITDEEFRLDNRLAEFLHYAGSGLAVDKTTSTDPEHVELRRAAFEAVRRLSTPHREYQLVIE